MKRLLLAAAAAAPCIMGQPAHAQGLLAANAFSVQANMNAIILQLHELITLQRNALALHEKAAAERRALIALYAFPDPWFADGLSTSDAQRDTPPTQEDDGQ